MYNDFPRLDMWLAESEGCSRAAAQAFIKAGHVSVKGKTVKRSYLVEDPALLVFEKPFSVETKAIRDVFHDIQFLFEDEHYVVIEKPIGCVIHGGAHVLETTLVDTLLKLGIKLPTHMDAVRPGIVHRLDKDTEGVMVIAKTEEAYHDLVKQFQNREVDKRYYAMVKGNVMTDSGVLDQNIGPTPKSPLKFAVRTDGKPSITQFKVLKRYNTKTLMEMKPVTGRTHQIRVHLAAFGHPVLQDALYGDRGGTGQLLQAYSLGFKHLDGRQFRFVLPLSSRLH